jgi:hypothetical protein
VVRLAGPPCAPYPDVVRRLVLSGSIGVSVHLLQIRGRMWHLCFPILMFTYLRATGVYTVALLAIVVASWIAPTMALTVADVFWPATHSRWDILLLNTLPPFAVGVVGTWSAAAWLRRRDWFRATIIGHVVRVVPFYALAGMSGWVLVVYWNNPDFWLIGQLYYWPWVAVVSGIGAEFCLNVL